ncbi:retrovirus-related pol polyprotein from transposon TNT 1-94 [Tanacetum coccineum]
MSKAKRSSFKLKVVLSSKGRLNLLHMDLCGPMRVASINEKKYILVIVDDYSRYTWTLFLRSKDETPEVLKDFLTIIQRNLQAQVISVRTDRGTEFLNKTLHVYFKKEGIEHQTSTPRTPEQNGIVERRNRTLVEAARTMLSASKLPLSFHLANNSNADHARMPMKLRKALLRDYFLSDKLVIDCKETKLHCNVFSRGRVRGVICKLCSSNVDEDTASRLWLQL